MRFYILVRTTQGEDSWEVLDLDPALNFLSSAMFYHKHHLHMVAQFFYLNII